MLSEFKTFIMRGNVVDLAVGVIIGAAFGSIVTSLVNDVLMPPIGRLLGGVDFKDFFISLSGQSLPATYSLLHNQPIRSAFGLSASMTRRGKP